MADHWADPEEYATMVKEMREMQNEIEALGRALGEAHDARDACRRELEDTQDRLAATESVLYRIAEDDCCPLCGDKARAGLRRRGDAKGTK